MLSAKDLVRKDMLDLNDKIFKLEDFLANSGKQSISWKQKRLLKKLLRIMKVHSDILAKQLKTWNEE
jgi:hypothetical protein